MATVYPAARNLCAAATYEGRARAGTRNTKIRGSNLFATLGRGAATAARPARDGPPSEGATTRRIARFLRVAAVTYRMPLCVERAPGAWSLVIAGCRTK
eukprot:scaffold24372_cov54-Phaeocystis_antarctica.AAC.2